MDNQEPGNQQPPNEDFNPEPASPTPVQADTPLNNPLPQKTPATGNTSIAFRDQQIILSMTNSAGPY